jgi:hypothetical protein
MLIGLGGTLFGISGMLMAGSFSVATAWPAPAGYEAHWHRVGHAYLWVTLASLIAMGLGLVMLWRARRSTRDRLVGERAD